MHYSLHIGVNQYDPKVWGPNANLNGCVNDALNMLTLAKKLKYSESGLLLDANATVDAVVAAIRHAATIVKDNETFLLSYSGHGTQVVDRSKDERDGLDEAICLHDGLLYDDELVSLLKLFRPGTRVNVVADTCHSEDQVRVVNVPGEAVVLPKFLKTLDVNARPKTLVTLGKMEASVIQYASCQSTEVSWDTERGGAFTLALLRIAGDGRLRRSASFIDAVRRSVKNQTPTLTLNNASRAHRMKQALVP